MLFKQDNKLCKRDLKSFEQHIKLPERVKNNRTCMSLSGFRRFGRRYMFSFEADNCLERTVWFGPEFA